MVSATSYGPHRLYYFESAERVRRFTGDVDVDELTNHTRRVD